MAAHVDVVLHDRVAEIFFSNPLANAMSGGAGVLDALHTAVVAQCNNSAVEALILSGCREECSAEDLNDLGDIDAVNARRAFFSLISISRKPVVVALQGAALGAGLEFALAAHFRIATSSTQFAFPEVHWGLLPCAGGTQRLPRLVGARQAAEMILSGDPIGAVRALEIGLIDSLVDGDLSAAALGFVSSILKRKEQARRPEVELRRALEEIDNVAARLSKRSLSNARQHIVECLKAAFSMDLTSGLNLEANHFEDLRRSEAALGLRHAFLAERLLSRPPTPSDAICSQPIQSVAVVGAGVMGTGIALSLLAADVAVTLIEERSEVRESAQNYIGQTVQRDVKKGRLSSHAAVARMAGLSLSGDLQDVANADLVIEAVFESMEAKCGVFSQLDRIAKPAAILASNTSTLDINEIAAVTSRASQVVGLHFFSPANRMKLVEVVRGMQTSAQTLDTCTAFVTAIKKIGVIAGVCDGFIGNRIFEEYLRQAYFLLEEGALPKQVDSAMESFGMAMGPLRTMDLAGQDIGWSIRKRRALEQPEKPYSTIPDKICELGRFGEKTGAGFYVYPDGRTAQVDPTIDTLIVLASAELGIQRRTIMNDEIISRCVLAMVNEGARIVGEGIASRPADVDVVYLNGYGFPAERGGPMFYADWLGLDVVVKSIKRLSESRQGWAWQPAPLLVDLVARGASFESLNAGLSLADAKQRFYNQNV